jgi:Spy/CpxP family protein refolding chaperone
MTRFRLTTMGITAVALVALALPAVAGQRGDGPRRHAPHRHAPHLKRILTAEQMEQIRPLLKAEREASKPLADLRRELRDAVLADAPDQGKIAGLQGQIGALQDDALTRRTALAQRVASLLTPEQRKQLRESRLLPHFLDPAGSGGRVPHLDPGGGGPRGGPGGPPAHEGL